MLRVNKVILPLLFRQQATCDQERSPRCCVEGDEGSFKEAKEDIKSTYYSGKGEAALLR